MLVVPLCLILCNPMDCSPPHFSMEFSKQEYWSELLFPSPGDLPDPGIEPRSAALAGLFFTIWDTRDDRTELHTRRLRLLWESRTWGGKSGQRKVLQRSRQTVVGTWVMKLAAEVVRSDGVLGGEESTSILQVMLFTSADKNCMGVQKKGRGQPLLPIIAF